MGFIENYMYLKCSCKYLEKVVIIFCNKGYYANIGSFHLWYSILVHKIYTFPFSSLSRHHDQIYTGLPEPKQNMEKPLTFSKLSHSIITKLKISK